MKKISIAVSLVLFLVVGLFSIHKTAEAACVKATPLFNFSPGYVNGTPGEPKAFSASVTNKDSADCSSNTYIVSATSLSPGFAASTASPLVLGPGQTKSTDIFITPPSVIANGTYNITLNIKDKDTNTYTQSLNVTYSVKNIPACVRNNPTITVSPTAVSVTVPPSLFTGYSFGIVNNDTGDCPSSFFKIKVVGLPPALLSTDGESFVTSGLSSIGSRDLYGHSYWGRFWNTYVSSQYINSNFNVNFIATDLQLENHGTASQNLTLTVKAPDTTCIRVAPNVIVTPTSRTGLPGTAQTYNLTIVNKDNAACGPSNFSFTATNIATGFTSSSSPTSLNLAPGATGTGSVTITSSSSVSSYIGNFNIQTRNITASSPGSNIPIKDIVDNKTTCVRAAPTLTLDKDTLIGATGATVTYVASITNNDLSACGNSTFTISASSLPAGFISSPTTVTLTSGATGTVNLNVTSPSNASNIINDFKIGISDGNITNHSVTLPATYNVSNPATCIRGVPTISISPATSTAQAGQTLTYTATVKNTDLTNCGLSIMSVAVSNLPAGFTQTVTPSTFGIGPNGSQAVELKITSPSTVTNSTNSFTLSTSDFYTSSHVGSSTGTYVVSNPINNCTRLAPTVSLNPTSVTGKAWDTLSYTLSVKNNDSAGCTGSSVFSLTTSNIPSGFTVTPNPTSLTLASGATGTATVSARSPYSATNGNYNFTVNVADSTIGSAHTGSTQGTYIVSNPTTCTRVQSSTNVYPASQTGKAGDALTYLVSVVNNDPAGCGSSNYNVVLSGLPSGFIITAQNSSWPPVTPNYSLSSGYTITSPTNAVNGSYPFTVTISDTTNGAIHSATATGTYVVNNPTTTCTAASPTVSVNPTSNTGPAGSRQYYTVTITNRDSGTNCSSTNFLAVPYSMPSGYYSSSAYVTVAPGATNSGTFYIYSPSDAANGTVSFKLDVSDTNNLAAHDVHPAAALTYIVSGGTSCTRATPTMTVTPTSLTGTSGTTKTLNVNIVNKDSYGCANATFYVSITGLPSGFTLGSNNYYWPAMTPGYSLNTDYTITPSSSVANGTYNFTVTATESSVPGHSVSTAGTFVVNNTTACTRQTPVVSIFASDSNTAAAGTGLWYVIRVANGDSMGCGSSSFTLSAINLPSGFTTSNPITLTVGPQSIGGTNFLITSPSTATNGTYTFSGRAVEVGGQNRSANGGTGTYIVSNPTSTCTRAAPTVVVSPQTQTGVANQTFNITVTVTNNDSAGCANTSFFVMPDGPSNGTTGGGSFAPGETKAIPLSFTPFNTLNNGTYNYSVKATDNSLGASHSGSGAATYTISSTASKISASSLLAAPIKAIKKTTKKPVTKTPVVKKPVIKKS